METIGDRIRIFRAKKNLSQKGLADLAGSSQKTISAIERGAVNNPGLGLLSRVAAALDVELIHLMPQLQNGSIIEKILHMEEKIAQMQKVRYYNDDDMKLEAADALRKTKRKEDI